MGVLMITLGFIGGLVLLLIGADILVRGSVMLATSLRIPMLVAGMTIVAFGTSAPELGVSLQASLSGEAAGIAVGNVIGSNIFNTLVILGIAAMITPIVLGATTIRFDVPFMIAISALLVFFCRDNQISRPEGAILFLIFVAYNVYTFLEVRRVARAENLAETFVSKILAGPVLLAAGLVAGGLILLILGSGLVVDNAVELANMLGISQLVIGLTIVAAGTSLPELATSVMAGIRGERDIAIGNVIGSNIFNILAVMGLSAIFSPVPLQVSTAAQHLDLPMLLAVSLICLPVFYTGFKIDRLEGLFFLLFFFAYMGYHVFLANTESGPEDWQNVILTVVAIVTVLILGHLFAQKRRKARG